MISLQERQNLIELLEDTLTAGARQAPACKVLGVSARTVQRWQAGDDGTVNADQRPQRQYTPSHKLTDAERAEVLAVANSEEFRDSPPSQIVPRLADQGRYLASESTFYRLLREARHQAAGTECHRRKSALQLGYHLSARRH